MTRSIGFVSHAILDYVLAILLAIAPSAIGFTGRQARWCYIFAVILFALALLTQIKLLRLPVHGAVELALAIVIMIMPWLGNFSRGVLSRNFYVAIGLLMILLWALTDFRGRRSAGRASGPTAAAP